MVSLAELLVVMKDRLKIVRNRDRNVPRVHGHKRLDDDVFLASLSPQESDGVACSMKQKKSSPDNLRMSGSGL